MPLVAALSGYKTYLAAAATALGAVAAVASGQMTLAQGAITIGALLTASFLRSGSKADAITAGALAAAQAVEVLAPTVVKLMPSTGKVATIVEQIAAEVEAALQPPLPAPTQSVAVVGVVPVPPAPLAAAPIAPAVV